VDHYFVFLLLYLVDVFPHSVHEVLLGSCYFYFFLLQPLFWERITPDVHITFQLLSMGIMVNLEVGAATSDAVNWIKK